MAGNKDIHNTPNAGSNGFDKNPQNINRNGRKPSIKKQLSNLLEQDGTLTIPKQNVIAINEDGSIQIKLPTQDQMAMKLIQWAMSKKGNDSLKAIQMIMEQIDGKPKQEIEQKTIDVTPPKIEFVDTDNNEH